MPKDELQAFDKLQAGDKVRVALLRLASRQAAVTTVRCSLRPEARHPSYVLGVTCKGSGGLEMRAALRRLSFFQNPARCAPQTRKGGRPAVASQQEQMPPPIFSCLYVALARLRAIMPCSRNPVCCLRQQRRPACRRSSLTGNYAARRTGSFPWIQVRCCGGSPPPLRKSTVQTSSDQCVSAHSSQCLSPLIGSQHARASTASAPAT